MNLEQAIGLVVDWVLARQAKADLRKLTLNQIGHYQELALR
jgi:hypothetical protein